MIVLASRSPRRRDLLEMLGIEHVVDPVDIDERPKPGEPPERVAVRLAREKAAAAVSRHPHTPVLAADTLVVLDGQVIGKPTSASDAEAMLWNMSGRMHRVVTAVALALRDRVADRVDVTRVWMRPYSRETVRTYVATGESLDKAGGYGVQGYGALLVDRIEGDFFGVMGLPLRLLADLLESAGLSHPLSH